MPLPTIDDIMTPPNPSSLGDAENHSTPITGDNNVFSAKKGHAAWDGNKLNISGEGLMNYWFIPAVQGKVSYCVVHGNGKGDAYVISDQYGGCELHELYHADSNTLAFLHVYRGGGTTTQYTLSDGWVLRSTKRSAEIAKSSGMSGSNWSVSLIDRSDTSAATVQSKFIHVEGYPTIKVTAQDDGDTPYG